MPAVKSPNDLCKIHWNKGSLEKSYHLTGSEYCKYKMISHCRKERKNQICGAFPVQPIMHFHFCLYSCLLTSWSNTVSTQPGRKEREKVIQERRVPDAMHQCSTQTAVPTKNRGQTLPLRRTGEDSFCWKGWFKELGVQCQSQQDTSVTDYYSVINLKMKCRAFFLIPKEEA